MQLAFSTLSCPAWGLDEILTAATELGYDGIEFRGIGREVDLRHVPEFSPTQIARTRERCEQAQIRVACLSSSVQIVKAAGAEVDRHAALAEAEHYIEMAKEVGAPYVRVFCGDVPATMEHDVALDRATEDLRRMGDYAHARQVTVVVETHDTFTRTEKLMELIRRVNHPAVQVLWDIHHPYRMSGESVEHSMLYLDGHVRHVHVKDSVLNADGEHYTYVPLGEGDVPLVPALHALRRVGYEGYLTLELEKRWIPELAGPETTLPQFITRMRSWLAQG